MFWGGVGGGGALFSTYRPPRHVSFCALSWGIYLCFTNTAAVPPPLVFLLLGAGARRRQVMKWSQLTEINAGLMDSLTYEYVAENMPVEYEARQKDKLRYRCICMYHTCTGYCGVYIL